MRTTRIVYKKGLKPGVTTIISLSLYTISVVQGFDFKPFLSQHSYFLICKGTLHSYQHTCHFQFILWYDFFVVLIY